MIVPPSITPLPGIEIYDKIEVLGLAPDYQTFPSSEKAIFDQLVAKHAPKTIIEVGTHKGGSAVRWARAAGKECRIYCVDTWLESAQAILCPSRSYPLLHQNGHPMTYWQFLNNMKTLRLHEQITPILNTSSEGAIILAAHRIAAPIIFIDGSHTFRTSYDDISDYWKLLEPGGSMLIDDMTLYPYVYAAIMRFVAENELWRNFEPAEDKMFGLLTKPS